MSSLPMLSNEVTLPLSFSLEPSLRLLSCALTTPVTSTSPVFEREPLPMPSLPLLPLKWLSLWVPLWVLRLWVLRLFPLCSAARSAALPVVLAAVALSAWEWSLSPSLLAWLLLSLSSLLRSL